MIPELGHYAMMLAACLALLQVVFPMLGVYKHNTALMLLAKRTAFLQCFFVLFAFSVLAYSFLVNDFSLVYVAQNSNTSLPWIYRFCAVWGAHEGSLLLWVLILTVWMSLVSVLAQQLPLAVLARVLSVLALIALGFYFFLLTTSDPFLRYLPHIPINGADLNPILQDPGLVLHPPILYMGYVGLAVPFAFAIAILLRGKFDPVWARWMRPWTLIAWCFLTLGIVLGSWWAYRELGWGGFWFWDPVENASFLPWLVATALLHVLIVVEKRDVFKAWALLLAIFAFSLSLLGTFLVRSGILISVHAFANDPRRGLYLLEFLLLVVGVSLGLYAWRSHKIYNAGTFHYLSREAAILANNLLLFIAMTTLLMGTLYPLIMGLLDLKKISVGAPYFNTVFFPLMWPLLFLMGIAPSLQWRKTVKTLSKKLCIVFSFSLVFAILFNMLLGEHLKSIAVLGTFLALWIMFGLPRRQYPVFFSHVGVAITVLGLVFASFYSQSRNVVLAPGEWTSLAGYRFQLKGLHTVKGPNYSATEAVISVEKEGKLVDTLYPQQRIYQVENTAVAKTAINATIFRDLYVALGAPLAHGVWGLRLYYKPMVRWIWWGGLFMVLGGIFSLINLSLRKAHKT